MKSAKGRLSPEQKKFIEHLKREGYRVEVCRSWVEAARLLVEYLDLKVYATLPKEKWYPT